MNMNLSSQNTDSQGNALPFDLHPLFSHLGMTLPIFQGPTGMSAGPELAGAVAAAGRMGALPHYRTAPHTAAAEMRQANEIAAMGAGAPVQVNFVLTTPPRSLPAVLAAGAQVITFSWGDPAQVRAAGASFGVQVTSRLGVRRALDLGADFLICQGIEAGGHVQSSTPLWRLLPSVLDEAGGAIPVIAAGGIGDGAGIARALGMGAAGALLGTRFVACQESRAHPDYKQALLAAQGERDTALTVCFDGGWPYAAHRVLRNATLEAWEAFGSPPVGERPGEGDIVARTQEGQPILRYADTTPRAGMTGSLKGGITDMCLYAGTSCAAIHDLPSARDLVARLWTECQATLQAGRTIELV